MYDFGYEKCLEAINSYHTNQYFVFLVTYFLSFQGKYRHQHIIFQGVYHDSNS